MSAVDLCCVLALREVEAVDEPKREVADRNAAELDTGAPEIVLDDKEEVAEAEEEEPVVEEAEVEEVSDVEDPKLAETPDELELEANRPAAVVIWLMARPESPRPPRI